MSDDEIRDLLDEKVYSPGSEDAKQRRIREDEARRLKDVVPHVASLKLHMSESRNEGVGVDNSHTRIIIIDRAPAVFLSACGDARCKGGGYDFTDSVLSSLHGSETKFEVSDHCEGQVGSGRAARCGREMKCVGVATYKPRG